MNAVAQVFTFDVLSKLLLGLATVLLIRFMPAPEYATYTLALSIVSLIYQGYIGAFGRVYIVSYHDLDLGDAGDAFLTAQLLGVGVLGVIGVPLVRDMGAAYGAGLILAAAMCLSEYAKVRFQRDLRFFQSSMVDIARSGIFLVLVSSLVALRSTSIGASAALIAQACGMVIAFAGPLRGSRQVELRLHRSLAIIKALIKGADRQLFVYFVILAVFGQVDVFMLRLFSGFEQVATYGSAFRYYTLLSLALSAVHTVLLPSIHRGRLTGEIAQVIRRQQRLVLVFVPVVLLGAWASGWLLPLIDGGRYPAAVSVFRFLCVSAILSFIFSPHANLVISDRAYGFMVTTVSIVLLGGVALDLVLIPRLGAVGAAISHLILFGLLNGSFFIRAQRSLRRLPVAALGA